MPMQISISNAIGGGGGSQGGASPTPAWTNTLSTTFDGADDFCETASTYSELNTNTKATWSVWLKPNLVGTYVISRVSSSTSTSAFVYQFVIVASGEVFMQIGDTTRRASTGSTTLADGVWSHILVCYDGTLANGSKTRIFINGIDATSTDSTTATSLNSSGFGLQLGRRDMSPTYFYSGLMDEFSIWSGTDESLNVSEIYGGGAAVDLNTLATAPNPTTWYRMGDGDTYPTILDKNGSANLTMTNMSAANFVADVPPTFNTLSTTFDGVDDFVDLGSPASLNLSTITISAWIKTTNNGSIVASDDQSLGRRFIFQILISGELRFYYWNTSSAVKNIVSTTTLNDGNWHHVMGINNGTDLKLYIDGVLDNSSLDGGNIRPFVSTPIHIGDRSYVTARDPFNGSIDEVAIWSSDQSTNASAIYNSGTPTDLTSYSPISWWRMGDGSTYPTINDEIGSNNGTMTNMTSANFVADVPT